MRFQLQLQGVSCNGCVSKIRNHLQQLDSSSTIEVDLETLQAQVDSQLDAVTLAAQISDFGYPAEPLSTASLDTAANGAAASGGATEKSSCCNSKRAAQSHAAQSQPVEQSQVQSQTQYQAQPQRASRAVESAPRSEPVTELALQGLTCAACVRSVEQALESVDGVQKVQLNFASRTAQVFGAVADTALVEAVERAGYGAEPVLDPQQLEQRQQQQRRDEAARKWRNTVLALGLGVPMMAYGMVAGMAVQTPTQQWGWGLVGLLTLLVMALAGGHFFVGAWRSLLNRRANMDSLIALGTGSAWLYSMAVVLWPEWLPPQSRGLYFEAAAMIIGLVNLGQVLELRARGKTQQAIRGLLDLQPKRAQVLRDGVEQELAVEQLVVGDLIRLRPGENVAVDGEVEQGSALVDESMLTGEPLPLNKQSGDSLAAGTRNTQGALIYRATRVGRDTALAGIIAMVQQAQGSKPPISQLADKIAAVFVPVVMLIALFSALAWWLLGPQPQAVYMLVSAVTVLIIACPCALGLATPISTMIGIGKAAELGVLIRNGDALQRASQLTTLVFDKTGTLTEGKPEVVEIALADGVERASLLRHIDAIEQHSQHPLAAALRRYCQAHATPEPLESKQFESLDGLGVRAELNGSVWLLGNERLMEQQQVALAALRESAERWQQQAYTLVYLACDGRLQAVIAIADPIRSDAAKALTRLHRLGVKLVMLTGDNPATAAEVSRQLGIDRFEAELLPSDKLAQVRQLQQCGEVVGMVGDGINDAPALSQADVSFAIGSGTDVAIESADVALMHDSLDGLADAIELSRATLGNIKQNLWGAFIYNSIGIPVAAGVLYPLTGLLLNPVIAGLAMSLSSVTVVSNANRLRRFKPTARSN